MKTINGAFTIEGEQVTRIASEFTSWVERQEPPLAIRTFRFDYSNWPDKSETEDKKQI